MQSRSRTNTGIKAMGKHDITKEVILIQKNWKCYYYRQKYLKMLKKLKKKNYTALEILQSERAYCEQLHFVIVKVLQPSKTIIDDDQLHSILFNKIEEIYALHAHFLSKLELVMKDYNAHTTCLSQPLLYELFNKEEFKKLYTSYCFNYKKTDQVIKLLNDTNKTFTQFLKSVGLGSSSQNLSSYMIKPVQRLCRYKLLLGQYFKNMQKTHIDYSNVQLSIYSIQKLVKQTNDDVQQFLLRERYRQIRSNYIQVFKNMPPNKRRLYFQTDNVVIVNLEKKNEITYKELFLFSDCIVLIPKQSNEEAVVIIYIIIRELPNFKYFKNMIQIIDNDKYYALQLKDDKCKKEFLQILNGKMKYNERDEYRKFIKVEILGTEQRQSFFSSYTVYIVQIAQNGKVTTIYPRFKNLLRIQDNIIQKGIKLNAPRLLKQSPYATLKTRIIQKRKLHIQEFLQRVFNNGIMSEIEQIQSILGFQSQNCIPGLEEYNEVIILLPNLQKVKIQIKAKSSKIKDLKSCVVENLGLDNPGQFQIFQVRNSNYIQKRLMYDDQPVIKIVEQQKSMQSALSSFNPFGDVLQYYYTRHYYLSNQEQYSLYKCDFIRAELQLSVIHSQILSYKLQEQLMITFMCLFAMYISLPVYDDDKLSTFIKQVSKKQYKISQQDFRIYYSEVSKMVTAEEDEFVTIPFLIIKIMSNNQLYQCQQFEVVVHSKCISQIKKEIKGIQQEIILGLKRSGIFLLTMKEKTVIKQIDYSNLTILETHPKGIVLSLSSIQTNLRLKTKHVYEITKLIEIYKSMK